jgi:Heterokaryon incompatibility protein (HET)
MDGMELTIRENLYRFLLTMKMNKNFCNSTALWVDQISINQENIEERG